MVIGKQNKTKTVLITGASRGIGRALAVELLNRGYQVIGTSRHPEGIKDADLQQVSWLALDLLSAESIEELIDQLDYLDVLINNAGASQMGAVEDVSMAKIREQFELNFFGHARLIKAVLPKMRERGTGKILNITSFASRLPVPFSAIYAASKAAMETLTKGLRAEVRRFGIDAITIAPTFVSTKIYQEKISSSESAYSQGLNRVKQIRDSNIDSGTNPKHIAQRIADIMEINNPRPFYAVGNQARLLTLISRFLPDKLVEKVIQNKFKL